MRSLLLTLAILATLSLQAQTGESTWSYVDYEPHSDYRRLEATDHGLILAFGTTTLCDRLGIISGFDRQGYQIWKKQLVPCGRSSPIDAFMDDQNNIIAVSFGIVTGINNGCSINPEDDGLFLLKLTAQGDTLFSRHISIPSWDEFAEPQVVQLPGSDYLIWVGDKLFRLDQNGEILDTAGLTARSVIDLQINLDSSLVWSYTDFIELRDTNRTVLSRWQAPKALIQIVTAGDTIWAMTRDSLYRFEGTDLTPKESIAIPTGFTPTGLAKKINRAGILVSGAQGGAFACYTLAENTFVRSDNHSGLGTDPRFALQIDNGFYVSGFQKVQNRGRHKKMKNGFVSSAVSGSNNENSSIQDVGLDLLSAGYIEPPDPDIRIEQPGTDSLIAIGYRIEYYLNLNIHNLGTDTLKSAYLFSNSIGEFNCTEARFQMVLDSLDLAPGESIEKQVQYGDLIYQDIDVPVDTYQYCFYVVGPNEQLDQNISNNTSCASFAITNTQEPLRPNRTPQIRLSPNPATGQVNIQLDGKDPIRSLILLNHAGQQMPVSYELNGQNAILQRSQLPSGLYYVRVQTEAGWGVRKLVWQ